MKAKTNDILWEGAGCEKAKRNIKKWNFYDNISFLETFSITRICLFVCILSVIFLTYLHNVWVPWLSIKNRIPLQIKIRKVVVFLLSSRFSSFSLQNSWQHRRLYDPFSPYNLNNIKAFIYSFRYVFWTDGWSRVTVLVYTHFQTRLQIPSPLSHGFKPILSPFIATHVFRYFTSQ